MITILYGESLPEPYCIDMRKSAALKEVNTKGINYDSLKGKFTKEVASLARTYPMFEDRRGVVLEVESLKDLDCGAFEEYCTNPAPFTDMVIICQNADKRLKVYKRITSKEGIPGVRAVLCDKKDVTRDRLVKTLAYELKQGGASMTNDAMEEFL